MNLETASNQELNIALTALTHDVDGWELAPLGTVFYHCGVDGSEYHEQPVISYCGDWNATMPLAVEHGLDIGFPVKSLGNVGTIAKYIENDTDIQVDFTNEEDPLRAIVICLIRHLQTEKS